MEFFQQYGFLKWQQCVPLIIDDSPIRESGNQNRQVQITMPRPEDEFHYYLCLQVAKSFGHHRIGAYCKQKYSFVPHSHAIFTLFLCFRTFVLFHMSLLTCLSYWILIQDPLSHSVLLCEWCTSSSNPRTERIFQELGICNSAPALIYDAFIGVFDSLFSFWHSFLGVGSFIFNIMFTLILPMGPVLSSPRHFQCDVDGAST